MRDFDSAKHLLDEGLSSAEVGRRLGIPRGTVQRWNHRSTPPTTALASRLEGQWNPPDTAAYCELLGWYLGDGHLTHRPPNGWTLRIFCDERYVALIEGLHRLIQLTFPDARSHQIKSSFGRCEVISVSHPALGAAFPQHGPGLKHTRRIELAGWQRELTHAHPDALIRGLIHSDGCRTVNTFSTKLPSGRIAEYSYVRYFFTNHSADIRGIFIEHCELLGIRVTQPNHRNLAVSHRASVRDHGADRRAEALSPGLNAGHCQVNVTVAPG